jgi:type IV secretory pathway TraG/TraD family ATPase VirD4
LSKEDNITPQDLEDGYDVFLSIPEDKIDQWKNLLTLITNQFLKHFERREDKNARLYYFYLIIQSLAQLDAIYGHDHRRGILDNCAYKAILSATDADTQEYFSRLVGTHEKKRRGHSANFEPLTGEQRGYSTTENTIDARIIKPEDFATLTDVVLLTPFGFFKIDKVTPYFDKRSPFFNRERKTAPIEMKTISASKVLDTSKTDMKSKRKGMSDTEKVFFTLYAVMLLPITLIVFVILLLPVEDNTKEKIASIYTRVYIAIKKFVLAMLEETH